ncbi:HAMP domain-containing histidine kinase [Lachnospiraceae bacterium OttesenSCG-928-D06]|nr:HAMP domain-containing histidine kinase [Lachnospiraceae bacterium OttesenSCG-928-D06]
MFWFCLPLSILMIIIIALLIKIAQLHKAADEIATDFAEKVATDTNALITLSTRDRHMRRLAASLNIQLKQLNKQRHQYQRGSLELREAITNISHDLRTPLTVICGYLDLLKQEENPTKSIQYLYTIENRVDALKQLTEELFHYTLSTSTLENINYEDIILNNILEESISTFYTALTEQNIIPKISMPKHNITRKLDPHALSRIFSNIISNAVKYSDGDLSIVLQSTGEMVFSNATQNLTPVTVGKLFDRFFTVETGRSSTGLGLSIAKLLTEQMGGSISAIYADGRLSVFLKF